jgi:mannosyltransferase
VAVDVVLVGGLTAVLGLIGLGTKSLWIDEGFSAIESDTRGTHSFLLAWYHGDPNETLYYLLLHFWSYLGTTEATLRALSVLFAVGGAVMTYVLGKELFGRRCGITAGLLLAINSFSLSFAQTLRGYSLLLFLTVLSTYLLVKVLQDDRTRYWLSFAVVTAAGCYVHYFMAMVLGSQLTYLALIRPRREVLRRLAYGLGATALLAAPIAFHAARANSGGIDWIPATSAGGVVHIAYDISGGRVMLGFTVAAMLAAGGRAVVRRGTPDGDSWLLLVLGLGMPIVGGLIASAVLHPLFVNRYYIECVPFIALTLSAVVWQLPRPVISVVTLAVLVGFATNGVVGWYDRGSFQDWRGAVRYITADAAAQPQVLTTLPGRALQYYLERDSPSLAKQTESEPPGCEETAGPTCLSSAVEIVLVTSGADDVLGKTDAAALAGAGYVAQRARDFDGLAVTRYVRPTS